MKVRERNFQEKADQVSKKKEATIDSNFKEIYAKEKTSNADNIRSEKRKLEKIKIKQELKTTK